MKKAEDGEVSLLFLDASHFVMGCDFLGHIYGRVRRYVKTFSGRRRYNVLGVLDYVSKKMFVVANDSYITASEVSSKYYDDFDAFKQKIDSTINSTDGKNKPKINRLIGKGVQLFHNLVPVAENTFAFLSDDKNVA